MTPSTYTVTVQFARLGMAASAIKRPERDVHTYDTTDPSEVEVARIVSYLARRVVPGLEGCHTQVRLTTPDGGPWTIAHFYLEDTHTGRRYGHGDVQVREAEHGHPWPLNPYLPENNHRRNRT